MTDEMRWKIIKGNLPGVPTAELEKADAVMKAYGLDLALNHGVVLARKNRRTGETTYKLYVTRDGLLALMHKMDKPWSLLMDQPQRLKNPYTNKDDVWLEGRVEVVAGDGTTQVFKGGVWLSEYNSGMGVWKSNPHTMHFKVVEVFLYRRASNVALTAVEEMDRVLASEGAGAPEEGPQPITDATRTSVNKILHALGFERGMRAQVAKLFAAATGLDKPTPPAEATEEAGRRFITVAWKDGAPNPALAKIAEKAGVEIPAFAPPPAQAQEDPPGQQPREPEAASPADAFPPPEELEDS